MSQPALFRFGSGHHAERIEKLFALPSRLAGSPSSPVPPPVLNTAGWLSGLWVTAALLGLGMFSGGTTSLVQAVVLLYGTGASLAVLCWLAWRALRMRAARRLAADPAAPAAREFLAAAAFAREEFLQALFPAGATGTPEVLKATAPARAAAAGAPRTDLRTELPSGPAAPAVPRSARARSPIRKNVRRKSAMRPAGRSAPRIRDCHVSSGSGKQAA